MTLIHKTAVVDPDAELASSVQVGPFAVIEAGVQLGEGCQVMSRVNILRGSRIGKGNTFFPGCVIGGAAQDASSKGDEETYLEIGDHNIFREFVTANRGTFKEEGVTRIGDHNLFMANVHIAHDCVLEDHITMANACLLAGHIRIESHAIIGGMVAAHHFVRFGKYCYVAGAARVSQDVPPFVKYGAEGGKRVQGINVVGLKRGGFEKGPIDALVKAGKMIFGGKLLRAKALAQVEADPDLQTAEVQDLLAQLKASEEGRFGRALEAHRKGKISEEIENKKKSNG